MAHLVQTGSDGTQSEVSGETAETYILSIDDIGYFMSVSCVPQRNDGAQGEMVFSRVIGPVIPGKLS